NIDYKQWLETGNLSTFPNGENGLYFRKRCIAAFESIVIFCKEKKYTTIAIVCHGGTIMSILEAFSHPTSSFYDWKINNLNGFYFIYDEKLKKTHAVKQLSEELKWN
ncbi:MAG: histidine phosphatase family protein, partial [Oscillospiraceae bacterium]